MRVVQYMQAFDPGDKPHKPEIYGSRAASFFFANEVLVGYNFESSFASDNTDFDLSQTDHIKPGQTTKKQVEALLGRPVGHYLFPLAEEPGMTAVTYLYLETAFTKSGPWHFRKEAIITFDGAGIVSAIKYRLGDS